MAVQFSAWCPAKKRRHLKHLSLSWSNFLSSSVRRGGYVRPPLFSEEEEAEGCAVGVWVRSGAYVLFGFLRYCSNSDKRRFLSFCCLRSRVRTLSTQVCKSLTSYTPLSAARMRRSRSSPASSCARSLTLSRLISHHLRHQRSLARM